MSSTTRGAAASRDRDPEPEVVDLDPELLPAPWPTGGPMGCGLGFGCGLPGCGFGFGFEDELGGGGHRGKGPIGFQRSDERIREDVCEILTEHDLIDASGIEVTVNDGEVVLTGHVPDRRTKRLTEACIEPLCGVRDVLNQLRVSAAREASGRRRGRT